MKTRIIVDSTADLLPQVQEQVAIVPLTDGCKYYLREFLFPTEKGGDNGKCRGDALQ